MTLAGAWSVTAAVIVVVLLLATIWEWLPADDPWKVRARCRRDAARAARGAVACTECAGAHGGRSGSPTLRALGWVLGRIGGGMW